MLESAGDHTHLADILLKTALKLFWLSANSTLEARVRSCATIGLSPFGMSEKTPRKRYDTIIQIKIWCFSDVENSLDEGDSLTRSMLST